MKKIYIEKTKNTKKTGPLHISPTKKQARQSARWAGAAASSTPASTKMRWSSARWLPPRLWLTPRWSRRDGVRGELGAASARFPCVLCLGADELHGKRGSWRGDQRGSLVIRRPVSLESLKSGDPLSPAARGRAKGRGKGEKLGKRCIYIRSGSWDSIDTGWIRSRNWEVVSLSSDAVAISSDARAHYKEFGLWY